MFPIYSLYFPFMLSLATSITFPVLLYSMLWSFQWPGFVCCSQADSWSLHSHLTKLASWLKPQSVPYRQQFFWTYGHQTGVCWPSFPLDVTVSPSVCMQIVLLIHLVEFFCIWQVSFFTMLFYRPTNYS